MVLLKGTTNRGEGSTTKGFGDSVRVANVADAALHQTKARGGVGFARGAGSRLTILWLMSTSAWLASSRSAESLCASNSLRSLACTIEQNGEASECVGASERESRVQSGGPGPGSGSSCRRAGSGRAP